MKEKMLNKTLVVGIIVLFVGVGVQPAFAEISIEPENNELEEVTIQFFEADRKYNHTVMLTQEQVKELNNLISNFENRLNSTDNPIELETIYNDAIISLNALGFLPDHMSIDYVQRLVTGKEQDSRIINIFERTINSKKGSFEDDENFLCLISGRTTYAFSGGLSLRLILIWSEFLERLSENYYFFALFLSLFVDMLLIVPLLILVIFAPFIWNYIPISIGYDLGFGAIYDFMWETKFPSKGWVHTTGLNGIKTWDGKMYGNIPLEKFYAFLYYQCFPGALGFTGIKIPYGGDHSAFYFGFALWVKIRLK